MSETTYERDMRRAMRKALGDTSRTEETHKPVYVDLNLPKKAKKQDDNERKRDHKGKFIAKVIK